MKELVLVRCLIAANSVRNQICAGLKKSLMMIPKHSTNGYEFSHLRQSFCKCPLSSYELFQLHNLQKVLSTRLDLIAFNFIVRGFISNSRSENIVIILLNQRDFLILSINMAVKSKQNNEAIKLASRILSEYSNSLN